MAADFLSPPFTKRDQFVQCVVFFGGLLGQSSTVLEVVEGKRELVLASSAKTTMTMKQRLLKVIFLCFMM